MKNNAKKTKKLLPLAVLLAAAALLGILLAMVIDTAATTLEHSDSRILQRS